MQTIVLLAMMATLCNVAHGGGRVTMTLLALQLGADAFGVGMLIALYALGPLVFAIYAGKIIDRVGARLPMMLGSGGIAMLLLLPATMQNLWVMYGTAFLLGLSFMLFFVATQGITGAIGSAFGFYPVFVLNALMLVGGGTLHGRSAAKPTGDEAVKRDAQ